MFSHSSRHLYIATEVAYTHDTHSGDGGKRKKETSLMAQMIYGIANDRNCSGSASDSTPCLSALPYCLYTINLPVVPLMKMSGALACFHSLPLRAGHCVERYWLCTWITRTSNISAFFPPQCRMIMMLSPCHQGNDSLHISEWGVKRKSDYAEL